MIISLRGTHGSGKSTVVKTLLTRYNATEIPGLKKPDGYWFNTPWLVKPVYVVGSYKTACGGCDSIQPYALIWPRVEDYATKGHVLFEGALVSSSYGNIGRASEQFGDEMVFAFMTTPLDVCLARIAARRKAKGNDKPVDPRNTASKLRNVEKSIDIIRDREKRRTVMIDYRKPVSQILGLLNSAEEGAS